MYSDFSLILGWFWNRHWKYAISMSIPVLLQFFFTVYKWCRLEKKENKKWSWPILLLQFWPQWRAIRIMRFHFQNDKKAEEKKKEMMQEISSTEPFLEAWPSIIIMTIIIIFASNDYSFIIHCESDRSVIYHCEKDKYDEECVQYLDSMYQPPKYCQDHPESNQCAIYGGFGGKIWFYITYGVSIITGSLGVTKFLQVGPFSVLTTEGSLGGTCKWRFTLAFLSVFTSMITKGCYIAILAIFVMSRVVFLSLLLGVLILPNLLYSFICIANTTGLNKKFIEVILAYPAGWMLPIATYFVIGPTQSSCCYKTNTQRNNLGFSKFHTIINIILTAVIYVAFGSYYVTYDTNFIRTWIFWGPFLFASLIFNIAFLLLDEKICCSKSQHCFCMCCCSYECYIYDTHVIDTNNLKVVKIDA